ncbi:hypothetical protein Acsp04_28290 [Actinomadura sp. NBRC 104425]|uniref:DUF4407 domain-containing protein n=1 Tax=Actinomadura sp. NBRC 104425 TaxID=3032204 RepID=UPI0024A474A4|nr:DUF4407 domain-containing protein [Actinomadura sp. NBRC 104425]GLZ12594.1 hypothetical protein Acsp04_28290 [Actinomadura sp. NBRC 104425]
MVAQLARPAGSAEPAGPGGAQPYRPAPPGDGVGRWLRARIGVVENVLDYTPELRPHYTKVGALVLTTSALAAVSMWTALVKFLDVHWLLLAPVAAFWGWLIFCIDSWLITTMHGSQSAGRSFWVRLVLAGLLGFVIAEPLLLKVFEPAIHRQVAENRVLERAERESALKACNPVPYRELTAAERERCRVRRLLLTVPADPGAVSADIATLRSERKNKQEKLDADKKSLQRLRDDARKECNGHNGPGLSGVWGAGPRCAEANRDAESFAEQSRLDARQKEINDLDERIKTLVESRESVARDYATQMNQAIKAQLPPPDGEIGLLEEHKALGSLSGESLLVLVGPWLLRLLLVVVDCLPVLSKRLSGPTAYDRNIARQLGTGETLFELDDELRRRRDQSAKETELGELDRLDRARQRDRDAELERTRVRQDKELNRKIDEYARWLRGEA